MRIGLPGNIDMLEVRQLFNTAAFEDFRVVANFLPVFRDPCEDRLGSVVGLRPRPLRIGTEIEVARSQLPGL